MLKRLVVYYFLFSQFSIFAQSAVWQSLNTSDGLSHSYIYQIYQTKDGYIWISTNDGLNRYDGYHFKVFLPDEKNPFSISDNRIKGIYEDRKGRLWITTQNHGLNLFDRVHNKFYHCQLTDKVRNKKENISGYDLVEDADGNIWIGGGNCIVFKIEIPTSWENAYPKEADFANEVKVTAVRLEDRVKDIKYLCLDKNTLWAGQSAGKLYKIDTHTLQKTEVLLPNKSNVDDVKAISGIYKDHEGTIWVSQINESLYQIKNDKISRLAPPLPDDFLHHIWLDREGFVWLKTPDNEVFRVFCQDFSSTNLKQIKPILYSKSKSYKTFIYTKENTIFVGDVRGIKKIDNRKREIQHYLAETDVTMVFRSRKGDNIVTTGGVSALFRDNEPFIQKPIFAEIKRANTYQTKNGDLWVVGEALQDQKVRIFHYSENLKLMGSYPIEHHGDQQNQILTEDVKGNLWIATTYGNLNKFDTKNNQVATFKFNHVLPPLSDLHSAEPYDIYYSSDQSLWIACEDGLIHVENIEKKPTFKIFKANEFHAVIDDPYLPNEYLWAGTKNFGLCKMNKKTGEFQFFTKNEGLPNNTIWNIFADKTKRFWVSSNKGIFKFDPLTKAITIFTRKDGLQGETYNKKAAYQNQKGEIVFAGNNGFNLINPSLITNKVADPNVKITNIEVNNRSVSAGDDTEILTKSIENTNEIELKSNQNTIKIYFAVLDYTDPENNIFRYQLEGLDEAMVEAGTEHTATYVSLPAGSYTFKLYGSNRGGNWNKSPVVLHIRVLPPWYRTWWAYLLYFAIIGYIVYRFYQFQINKVKLSQELAYEHKEKERLAELDQAKTNFFANISHEFRTPLTLILAPIEDLIKKNPSDETLGLIKRNANRLLQLINQVLDLSKLESNKMSIDESEVELKPFFRRITSAFSSIAESKKLAFEIQIFEENYLAKIDDDKTEKIINNLLSNAFKFTEKGKVSIKIEYDENSQNLKIRVNDTGLGIPKEKIDHIFNRFYQIDEGLNRRFEGTGIGLALVKELVEIMKGEIKVESEVGIGTTFEVILPIHAIYVGNNKVEPDIISETSLNNNIQIADYQDFNSSNVLLVVDDNDDIRAYIRSVFESEYSIIEAVNGFDGIAQATKFIPNLIISDLMMPQMDGFEFCKNLKTDEKTSHIPIIMLTAKANMESKIEGLELGADDYLLKPFNTDEVKIRVKNLVQKQKKLQAYFSQKIIDINPEKVKTLSAEDKFMLKVKEIIEKNLSDSQFGVESFCQEIGMSQSQLLRKVKAISNKTPVEFIREYRLQRAADLLKQKAGGVSEIAFEVGFESLSYFTRAFQERFGKLPSEVND